MRLFVRAIHGTNSVAMRISAFPRKRRRESNPRANTQNYLEFIGFFCLRQLDSVRPMCVQRLDHLYYLSTVLRDCSSPRPPAATTRQEAPL